MHINGYRCTAFIFFNVCILLIEIEKILNNAFAKLIRVGGQTTSYPVSPFAFLSPHTL